MALNKKVIHTHNLPTRLPVAFTLALYTLLRVLNVPGWVWGAAAAVMALVWLAELIAIY